MVPAARDTPELAGSVGSVRQRIIRGLSRKPRVAQLQPETPAAPTSTEPRRCLTVSQVIALNYGEASDAAVPALAGLSVADALLPPNPISPVFFALAGRDDGGGDTTL